MHLKSIQLCALLFPVSSEQGYFTPDRNTLLWALPLVTRTLSGTGLNQWFSVGLGVLSGSPTHPIQIPAVFTVQMTKRRFGDKTKHHHPNPLRITSERHHQGAVRTDERNEERIEGGCHWDVNHPEQPTTQRQCLVYNRTDCGREEAVSSGSLIIRVLKLHQFYYLTRRNAAPTPCQAFVSYAYNFKRISPEDNNQKTILSG